MIPQYHNNYYYWYCDIIVFIFIEAMALVFSANSAAVSQSLPSEGIIIMIAWIINV